MKLEIGFGDCPQSIEINDANVIDILTPNNITINLTDAKEVQRALNSPIGTEKLSKIIKQGEKIVIITSDITRPMPTHIVMPVLLDELYANGINPDDITLVFALGSHRKHTQDEIKKLAGERAYAEITCIDADSNDCICMGKTNIGTPVDITRIVACADKRICLGNIEYHYFAGYSGGAKAIMPGVSTKSAIQCNHSLMIKPMAVAGNLENNPVRKDLEEAIKYCPIDFIINVVLDEHKKIIHAVAGHFIKAHRAGCNFLDSLYCKTIPKLADIVVVSQGGAPKDINLYQTQKALDNAKHAVRKGGIIILVGACNEGLGEETFEKFMTTSKSPNDMVLQIAKKFELGGHKAAAIGLVLENADIYLVSKMDANFVTSIFLKPYNDVQTALDDAFKTLGKDATVIVMPYGGSTLPKCK